MRRPKLPLIPGLLILLKKDITASHVLASLHHLLLAPIEGIFNIASHTVSFGLVVSFCFFLLKTE